MARKTKARAGAGKSRKSTSRASKPSRRASASGSRSRTVRSRNGGADAIALLMQDHRMVEKLFKRFEKLKKQGDKRGMAGVVEEVCSALTVHTTIEEEIFYPAARRALKEQDLLDEAEVEHDGAKRLIEDLEGMSPGDDLYDAKVMVLSEYIKHHVKEEETEMFPKAKKTRLDTEALGEQLMARKQELQGAEA
jgi:hemerythrin superfamily protein